MLTPGQASDLHGFDALAGTIQADVLIADKGYDADKRVRAVVTAAGKTAVIPPRRNRKTPVAWEEADKERYKKRHKIENFFSRLKDFRGIATRYEKTARNFLAAVQIAATLIWLN